MKIYTTKEELFAVNAFVPKTKADHRRGEKAWEFYTTALKNGNPGGEGGASEILSRLPRSNKMTVARQDKVDCYFYLNGKRTACERKTNGGRVNGIKERFVAYSITLHNSTGSKVISPRIIRTDIFLAKLEEFNAIKAIRHNGEIDGYGVQVSNRKLWAWLEEQVEFHREWNYYTEDFEA